jgi:hypothetical protein
MGLPKLGRTRNGDPDHLRVCRGGRRFLGRLVMAPDEYDREHQEQRQQNPQEESQTLAPGTRRNRSCRELMLRADVRVLFWNYQFAL